MRDLLLWQMQRHFRHHIIPLIVLLQFTAFAIGLHLMWQKYAQAQAAQIQNLSFSHDVLTPLYGLLMFLLIGAAPIHALPAFSSAQQAQLMSWWRQSERGGALIVSRLMVSVISQLLFLLPASFALLSFIAVSAIDYQQWLTVLFGNVIVLVCVQLICITIGAWLRQWFMQLLLAYAVLAFWIAIDLLPGQWGLFSIWLPMRESQWSLRSVLVVAALTVLAALVLRTRWRLTPHNKVLWTLPLVLFAASFAPLPSFSFTTTTAPQLSPALQQWLAQQQAPVQVRVVSVDAERRADYLAQLAPLQKHHSALTFLSQHPSELAPDLRDKIPDADGLLIEVNQRHDWISLPQPQLTVGVVIRLQYLLALNQAWIVFSEGHGERRIFSDENRDLGQLSQTLKQNGYTLAPFNWQTQALPSNTAVLVLSHLQTALLPAEKIQLFDYLDRGGHLLWLRDPDDAAFAELENYLGVVKLAGTVLDPNGVQRGTPHPAITLIDHYVDHDSVRALSSVAALPWSAAFQITASAFTPTPILLSNPNAVLQTREPLEQVDTSIAPQSYPVGIALQRSIAAQTQRIIVLGDSHFAANSAIHNYGNQALAIHLLRWLALADQAPPLPEFYAADAVFMPSAFQTLYLRWCWPVLVPMLILLWLVRRQWRWRQQA